MKRLALAVALLVAGAAQASDVTAKDLAVARDQPVLKEGMKAEVAVAKMVKAGWRAGPMNCHKGAPRICEVEFRGNCGMVWGATFLNQEFESFSYTKTIPYRGPGGPKWPRPCFDPDVDRDD